MDRWEDVDDGIHNRKHEPKGRVAALGIQGFVRGAVEAADSSARAGIQVVASKKASSSRQPAQTHTVHLLKPIADLKSWMHRRSRSSSDLLPQQHPQQHSQQGLQLLLLRASLPQLGQARLCRQGRTSRCTRARSSSRRCLCQV